MKILISACLLGLPCRYDGASKPQLWVEELARRHELIPMCPEQMGGLPTPRNPSEWRGDRVVMRTGEDVTEQYRRGAACALRLYQLLGCKAAVLKERSPSCGCGAVYDGTFTGTLTAGLIRCPFPWDLIRKSICPNWRSGFVPTSRRSCSTRTAHRLN